MKCINLLLVGLRKSLANIRNISQLMQLNHRT